jgi:transcriptional regulator with XRE-family HTH domain
LENLVNEEKTMKVQTAVAIRSRKLGLLIRDARLASRKTLSECAGAINTTSGIFKAYEEGRKSPSLPELEALAYFLQMPISRFWSKEAISDDESPTQGINLNVLIPLRQRMVGAMLRQKRMEASLSVRALSEETGISQRHLNAYELGETPIPLPELEACLAVLGGRIESFFDHSGPMGLWMQQQQAIQEFLKLPPDLQAFVCMPVNRPYLDLARNMSQISTEKMRSIAEGLLEITL